MRGKRFALFNIQDISGCDFSLTLALSHQGERKLSALNSNIHKAYLQEHHTWENIWPLIWERKAAAQCSARWMRIKSCRLQQLHRFPNGMINVRGVLHWDVIGMYREMLTGITAAVAQNTGKIDSIGFDTWGVDFGLFDGNGFLIGDPIAYRDSRRLPARDKFLTKMTREKLYELTSIQLQYFNTVFELYAMSLEKNPQLEIAKDLLFMPDIFNYFFTGKKATEFSFATTTQLYNIRTDAWEKKIFAQIGIPMDIMQKVVRHGTVIGMVEPEIRKETGLNETPVLAVGSHDTASAVAACPLNSETAAYISSGTWSLMGIETKKPIISEKAFKYNFTNEGGICDTYRVLKNISGLWLLQEYKREEAKIQDYSYAELSEMGRNAASTGAVIDPDAPDFIKPESMSRAIADFCRAHGQPVPQSVGEYVRLILESLALDYRYVQKQIEEISGRKITQINIIGGGSQNHGALPIRGGCYRAARLCRSGRSHRHR